MATSIAAGCAEHATQPVRDDLDTLRASTDQRFTALEAQIQGLAEHTGAFAVRIEAKLEEEKGTRQQELGLMCTDLMDKFAVLLSKQNKRSRDEDGDRPRTSPRTDATGSGAVTPVA